MALARRYARFVTTHSRVVIVLMLVLTIGVGYGAGNVDGGLSITNFESDTTEAQKLEYAEANFTTGEENTTVVQIVIRGSETQNVLSKASLLETLRLQRTLRADAAINATLRDERPMVGIANLVATTALRQEGQAGEGSPSIDDQIDQLESMSEREVESVLATVLAPDRVVPQRVDPYTLLSTDYETGSTRATGRILFVFQDTGDGSGDGIPEAVLNAQLAIREAVDEQITSTDAFAFGAGIVDDEAGSATGESFALITPAALVLIVVLLGLSYRDIVDVTLGLVGVVLVIVWMGGIMGWLGIGLTQLIIAVPFLLIGLSIDYALHVVMRYREAVVDFPEQTSRESMRHGLAAVVIAIGAATFSTAVGFGSNLVSPIRSIQEFATVSALGIVSAFLVFGLLLPALKLEIDGVLRFVGFARDTPPYGRGGMIGRTLGIGQTVAGKAPVVVVALAVMLSVGGAVAATDIDTSIDQVDFLPRETPDWMASLPEPFAPSEYTIRSNAMYLNDRFVQSRAQSRAIFLIEGNVTDPETLVRLSTAKQAVRNTTSALTLADDTVRVDGPLEVIESTAARNETVAGLVETNDVDGDGVPDRNITAIYDAVFEANSDEAAAVIHRRTTPGGSVREYQALRMSVALEGGADSRTVTTEMRSVAADMETGSDLTVTATGRPIVDELLQRGLLATLVEGFVITFGVITAFLSVIFWRRYGTASMGLVVITPVVLSLAWLFGTMYLAGISFNTETAIIASIAIGIGVDYAIHVGERFMEERTRSGETMVALDRTMRGTGGALFASAVSTAGGFGVLMLALVPSLQRFGFVTATAILYAFLASVLVLPSLLTIWSR